MIYKEFRRKVEKYLRMQDPKLQDLIRDFTNTSILQFVRMREWRLACVSEAITLDGSDEYSLLSLRNRYGWEVALIDSTGTEYDKYEYQDYLALPSKAQAYAIFGETLFVTGDSGDLTFLFMSPGRTPRSDVITAVNTGTKTFTVAGNKEAYYRAGEQFVVSGSTGNDQNGVPYTVVSATYDLTNTNIVVSEAIPDTTADGSLYPQYRYPLEGDYNRSIVLDNYPDIIKRMVIVSVLNNINDSESAQNEMGLMNYDITQLIKSENRSKNQGKIKMVVR